MFIPETGKIEVPPIGNPKSKIAIVGDWTSGYDVQARAPFQGYAGNILERCLHNAGLIRGELYLTNLVKERTSNPLLYYNEARGTFTERGMYYVHMLQAELQEVEANVVVAMGSGAFSALCSLGHLSDYRGYIFPSTLYPGLKVIPTHHPSKAMRGMYTYQYLIASDLRKARLESHTRELNRPERELIYTYGSVEDALDILEYYENQELVGFDIEVLNYEVSCISFASSTNRAAVIPIADRWTVDEELAIWRGVQKVLGNPKSKKVIQNAMFDIPFLMTRNGIIVRGEILDTMIGHSILFSDLPKSLGFLGSIYCGAQEYWKDTVKFKSIKEED